MESIISGVGVLDKAVTIIDALEREPMTLSELVDATGVSRATAHRLATALEAHGLVSRDPEGRFRLGTRMVALGNNASAMLPLADLARPILADLRNSSEESAQLYVVQGDHRVCIAALDSPHELRTIVAPGALLPLGVGSGGRLLAGEAPNKHGWIQSVEDRAPGVASVSAPVHDKAGRLAAAISVSGPIDRIGRSPGKRHGADVEAAAASLAALL